MKYLPDRDDSEDCWVHNYDFSEPVSPDDMSDEEMERFLMWVATASPKELDEYYKRMEKKDGE